MKRDQCNVQVWNDHSFPWEETFKGDKVTIPANGFKLMPFYEAYEFKGQFFVLAMNADETENAKTQKRIRCVEDEFMKSQSSPQDSDDGQEIFMCNAKECKKVFTTEAALVKHSEHSHADDVVVDYEAEREVPKRKPGRPAKVTATA